MAEHPHAARLGQPEQPHDGGPVGPQRRVHRVPGALPGIDAPPRGHRHPLEIEGEAAMADPLRAPLPAPAGAAALDAQLPRPRALPVGPVEPVGLGNRARHPRGQIAGRAAHRIASLASSMLETRVTIGPEMTSAARAPGTWLDDSPRTWRTASMCRQSPCM